MSEPLRVCLCMHLHQPNFQLPTVKRQALELSYRPWVELVEEAHALYPGRVVVSFHVSGSLLHWLDRHDPGLVARLRRLVEEGAVRLVGGLVDESFPQLSSRPDDLLFQAREYGRLLERTLGAGPARWDGFHVVEREASERLLAMVAHAARELGFPPIVYLDVETFYPTREPGPGEDLARLHYGASSSGSRSTFPGLPEAGLFALFRDEIEGRELLVAPIHSPLRYFFLKWRRFASDDRIVQGADFARDLARTARRARTMLPVLDSRAIPPLLLVFNDGELLGQWSQNPARDRQWMHEFFAELLAHPGQELTGLAEYREAFGHVETYPCKSSSSYVEFENWTSRRGIRGANHADPKLRTLLGLLRHVERRLEAVERFALERALPGLPEPFVRGVFDSPARGDSVAAALARLDRQDLAAAYGLVRRLLSVTYEADSHWATRHPDYGSLSCCDLSGCGYASIADHLIDRIGRSLGAADRPSSAALVGDFNGDGLDEVVLETSRQRVVVSRAGATVLHHQVHSERLATADLADVVGIGALVCRERPSFPALGALTQCVALTETDSELVTPLDRGAARLERCRDGYRTAVSVAGGHGTVPVGSFDTALFAIAQTGSAGNLAWVTLRAESDGIRLTKGYRLVDDRLEVSIDLERMTGCPEGDLLLTPQLVTTIVPADDLENRLEVAMLAGMTNGGRIELRYECHPIGHTGHRLPATTHRETWPQPGILAVTTRVHTGFASFCERIRFRFDERSVRRLEGLVVRPAVLRFYEGYVTEGHERLGYHQSGVMLQPTFRLDPGRESSLRLEVDRAPRPLESPEDETHRIDLVRPGPR